MLDPIDMSAAESSDEPARRYRRGLTGGATLAVSTTLSNAAGALMTVALAHSYSGGQFGGLAALLGIALIATVPATGLQYVVARRTSGAALPAGVHDRTSLQWAAGAGAAISAALVAASPIFAVFLDLPTPAVVCVALIVTPYMIASAQLGTMLGHATLVRLGIGQLILAGIRLAAVVAAGMLHASVTGVMAWMLGATWLTVICFTGLTGLRTWTARLPANADFARELAAATVTLAGISVLINLDLLLARHYLSADDSGTYALGSLFAKAGLWSAQFVPQLIFAKLARTLDRRAVLLRAVLADIAVTAVVLVAALVCARRALGIVSNGGDLDTAAHLAPLFALLGACWAVCYLVLLSAVALRNPAPGRLMWLCMAVEALLVVAVWHDSATQILLTCTIGALTLATLATISVSRDHEPADGDSAPALGSALG